MILNSASGTRDVNDGGQREAPLQVILPGFTLKRRDGPPLQLARLALIVAVPSWCGGSRGRLARRRRRGTECLRAASGAKSRNVSPEGPPGDRRKLRRVRVSVILARRLS